MPTSFRHKQKTISPVVQNFHRSSLKIRTNIKILASIIVLSLLFFIGIITDITPFIRGPHDALLESRWPYYFVNTYSKTWIFIPILVGYFLTFRWFENKEKPDKKTEVLSLFLLVLLTFTFQLALVYFSRFGITVLFRRLVDPGINGYFATAIHITNIPYFLKTFPNNVIQGNLMQHARGHTPGAVLFIKWFIDLISLPSITGIFSYANQLHIKDSKQLWETLTESQRLAALVLPFMLHFFASLTIIPVFYIAKQFFGNEKIAMRNAFLYAVMPSLSFFALLFDPLYAIFPIIVILLLFRGVKTKHWLTIFAAGIVTGIGLFFTVILLPVIGAIILFSIFSYIQKPDKTVIQRIIIFAGGAFVIFIILFLFQFNIFSSIISVLGGQLPRQYFPWLLFNPYDFFVFMGLPIGILFITKTISILKQKQNFKTNAVKILYTFWITFLALIISGTSRGEVGRIWLPFMFVPVLFATNFITKDLKFTKTQFFIVFMLLFIQVILMEEYWVPIW